MPKSAKVRIGKTGGRWYSKQAMIKFMVPFGERLSQAMPDIKKVVVFYDGEEDYYHAKFKRNGHICDIRFYKGFSVKIDGVDGWTGCPISLEHDFIRTLKEKTNAIYQGTADTK